MTEAPVEAGQTTPQESQTQALDRSDQGEGSGTGERTFTQADLKKIAANEKREGKNSAFSEILEKTGLESLDDLYAVAEAHRTMQAEMETEADRATKRAEKAEAAAQQAQQRYTTTLKEFAARDALRDAGVQPDYLKSAMRVGDLGRLEVDKDGNVTGLEEFVEGVRQDAAPFFGSGEAQRPRVNAPQTTATTVNRPSGQTPEEMQANWLLQMIGARGPNSGP